MYTALLLKLVVLCLWSVCCISTCLPCCVDPPPGELCCCPPPGCPIPPSCSPSANATNTPQKTTVKVSWGTEPMKVSTTGDENLMPSYYFMAGGEEGGAYSATTGYDGGLGRPDPFIPPDSCPDSAFENTMKDTRVPVMPYLEQDDWGCERKPTDFPVLVMETSKLRAAITPQWGGKIWSLLHKGYNEQMFFNNPAHQPDNIGYRKAWTSGGCEWNWGPGYIGHSVFTESPTWTAIIPTERGEIVRVWEFDRLNGTVWQVDVLLHNDTMWTHAKITNPTPEPVDGYWWTCVAMPVESKTRIVTPAEISQFPCVPWPYGYAFASRNGSFRGADLHGCASTNPPSCAWQQDMSFLGNIPSSHDFFFKLKDGTGGERKGCASDSGCITHVRPDGFSVMHSHPAWMNGTKFFTWGESGFGKFQQDFMSASDYQNPKCFEGMDVPHYDPFCQHYERKGDYTELQLHTFPVPGSNHSAGQHEHSGSEGHNGAFFTKGRGGVEWTEWFKAWYGNASRMQHRDYNVPLHEVAEWLDSEDGMQQAAIDEMDKFMEQASLIPVEPSMIVFAGSPWGALHEARHGTKLAPWLYFNVSVESEVEARPWMELLERGADGKFNGTFSAATLAKVPVSWQIDDFWLQRLTSSVAQGHSTWLHWLHIGSCYLERGEVAPARHALNESMKLEPNVLAARNLAVSAKDGTTTLAMYKQAWQIYVGSYRSHLREKKAPEADSSFSAEARLGKDLGREFAIWLTSSASTAEKTYGGESAQAKLLWSELKSFLANLPNVASLHTKDHVLHARAALAVHEGNHQLAIDILGDSKHCFPTYGNDRSKLLELWLKAHLGIEQAALGRELSLLEIVRVRRKIGCDGDTADVSTAVSLTYQADGHAVNSPSSCSNGPPNLGYPY